MSELDKVLDALMRAKSDVIARNASQEEHDELVNALREKKKSQIISEIKKEYKEEIRREVDQEMQRQAQMKKIEELRSLMWNGFVLAFVVGLTVNQVTDVIGYYKGSVTLNTIWPTGAIIGGLLLICLGIYLYGFIKSAISLVTKKEECSA